MSVSASAKASICIFNTVAFAQLRVDPIPRSDPQCQILEAVYVNGLEITNGREDEWNYPILYAGASLYPGDVIAVHSINNCPTLFPGFIASGTTYYGDKIYSNTNEWLCADGIPPPQKKINWFDPGYDTTAYPLFNRVGSTAANTDPNYNEAHPIEAEYIWGFNPNTQLHEARCRVIVPASSLEEEINDIIDALEVLLEAGELDNSQGEVMVNKLENALKSLAKGKDAQAAKKIEEFKGLVLALMDLGGIPQADGENLLYMADLALDAM